MLLSIALKWINSVPLREKQAFTNIAVEGPHRALYVSTFSRSWMRFTRSSGRSPACGLIAPPPRTSQPLKRFQR